MIATVSEPSRIRLGGLTIAIIVVALIGLGDASYLTYEHYNGLKGLACFGGHGGHSSCYDVQSSVWSEVDGVSVALMGLIGYVAMLLSLFVRNELGRGITFGIALVGFLFSCYLTYRELFTIHEICEWCVGSAVCLTVLVILTGIRFLRAAPSAA